MTKIFCSAQISQLPNTMQMASSGNKGNTALDLEINGFFKLPFNTRCWLHKTYLQ